MKILVAGAHGGIGGRLVPKLVADGHEVVATVRNPEHMDELRSDSVTPVLLDVTGEVGMQLSDEGVSGVDAVVYSIGAGAGSGTEAKQTVDRAGSDKLVDWAQAHEVGRYVIVSSHGAHDPSIASGDFVQYLEAKRDADDKVADSTLNWTIVRPVSLTDGEGTGMVDTPDADAADGEIPRDDVAAFIAAAVARDDLGGVTTELTSGSTSVPDALDALASG